MRTHALMMLSFALCFLVTSCDQVGEQSKQSDAELKSNQTHAVHFHSPTDTNIVRVAGVAENIGGSLRATEWLVSRAVLDNQPRWDGFSSDPPLSFQRACSLALPEVRQRFPGVHDWAINSVHLRNLLVADSPDKAFTFPDVWVYEISFAPKDLEAKKTFERAEGTQSAVQVVLFDGTIVKGQEVK